MTLLNALVSEVALVVAACVLFLLGATRSMRARQVAPWIAMAALAFVGGRMLAPAGDQLPSSIARTIVSPSVTVFIKTVTVLIAMLLALLHWPTDGKGSRNSCLELGQESPEYFGLMLLSVVGVLLVAGANDLILLFLGIELASLPTYVMVSISRPIAVAQEAAVKYFFLGAFSAALTLLGLTFIFGATGATAITEITTAIGSAEPHTMFSGWLLTGGVLVILGLAFKLAAFPLHFYALDVYTGAATPLTAFLSFIPKITAVTALIRLVQGLGAPVSHEIPAVYVNLLWVMAVATMTVGNVLGLMQHNIKRMMACSSIAHSGYMLAGITVTLSYRALNVCEDGLNGVLFYLVAYGVMNVGVFAVLMMLPARPDPFTHDGKIPPATTAETMADLAGTGRDNVGLGMIMTICCLSLIGIPLTVGFAGKLFLVRPALEAGYIGLAITMVLNAALSAGYYLRIIGAMFLKEPRTEAAAETSAQTPGAAGGACGAACMRTIPLMLAGTISAGGVICLGAFVPLMTPVRTAARLSFDVQPPAPAIVRPLPEGSTPAPTAPRR